MEIEKKTANPQAEDGHTDIANELLEALAKINLRPYETRTLWALLRKTYGWHKKEDQISLTQFQDITRLDRRHQRKALKTLYEKNIISRKEGYIVTYGLQKDYQKWHGYKSSADLSTSAYSCTSADLGTTLVLKQAPKLVLKQAPKLVLKQAPTKEKKETIQKKGVSKESLEILYPYLQNEEFKRVFNEYLEMRKKIKKPATNRAKELVLKKLHKYPVDIAVQMLEKSIVSNWTDVYELKNQTGVRYE